MPSMRAGDVAVREGTTYFATRDDCATPTGIRVRRIPRDVHGHVTIDSLPVPGSMANSRDALQQVQNMAVVAREPDVDAPALLLRRERFGCTDGNYLSAAPTDDSSAPPAYARGPPLLPECAGGVKEHATLLEALEHTARTAATDCGITFAAQGQTS